MMGDAFWDGGFANGEPVMVRMVEVPFADECLQAVGVGALGGLLVEGEWDIVEEKEFDMEGWNVAMSEYGGVSFPKGHEMTQGDWDHMLHKLEFVFVQDDPVVLVDGVRFHSEESAAAAIEVARGGDE